MSRRRGFATRSACALRQLVCAVFLSLASAGAQAVEVAGLYSVEVPFDARARNGRTDAYRAALAEVLVRITGTTAAAQSEDLLALFPEPGQLVTQYRPGERESLVVSLDGPVIERVLRQAGAAVWGSDRPLTVIWLAVDWGLGEREIIAAGDQSGSGSAAGSVDRDSLLREQVQSVARRRGIPVVFPLMDTEDLQRIGFSDIWGGFDDQLVDASRRYAASSVLVGRIRADSTQPARWTWYLGDARFAWPGTPDEAIDELANALAGRFALRGNQSLERIELTIAGLDSVDAYGRVQRYMENLRIIDKLTTHSVSAGQITYFVELPGGAERLADALDLSTMLERDDRRYGIDASRFPGSTPDPRYDPYARPSSEALRYRFLSAPSVNEDRTQGG